MDGFIFADPGFDAHVCGIYGCLFQKEISAEIPCNYADLARGQLDYFQIDLANDLYGALASVFPVSSAGDDAF